MTKKLKIILFLFTIFLLGTGIFCFFNNFKKAIANSSPSVTDTFTDETMIATTSNLLVDTGGGQVILADVCDGVANNTQVPGCDGTCQACQNNTCGVADADTDPGNINCSVTNCNTGNCKGGTAECGWLTSGDGTCTVCKTCDGATSVACEDYTNNTQDSGCDGTCQACQSGNCGVADADTDPGNINCSATNCYTGDCKGGTAECKIYGGGQKGACGTCYYCNDADYQCDPVPNSTDPLGDCSPVDFCTNYIYGWSGNNCLKYSGSSANNGDCNGSGACYTSIADSCSGAGSASASCGSDGCKKACVANSYYTSYDTVGECCYTSEQNACSDGYACDSSGTCVQVCGGWLSGGNCWYQGAVAESCTTVCASHGLSAGCFTDSTSCTACKYWHAGATCESSTSPRAPMWLPEIPGCYYQSSCGNWLEGTTHPTGQRLCVCNQQRDCAGSSQIWHAHIHFAQRSTVDRIWNLEYRIQNHER